MTNLGSGDPVRKLADYYPAWLDNFAGTPIGEHVATSES